MTEHFAHTFKSDLDLDEMIKRLNEFGPWKWHESDNDRWGVYYSSTPLAKPTQHAYVKILIDPDDTRLYVVEAHFQSIEPDAKARLDELRATLFDRLLPAIGAHDLVKAETCE